MRGVGSLDTTRREHSAVSIVLDKSIRRLVRVVADVWELKYRLEILLTY